MPKIERMFAFITEDEPGSEGIIGAQTYSGWMPLVGADMKRVESLRPIAQATATATGKSVALVLFEVRKVVEIITPKKH